MGKRDKVQKEQLREQKKGNTIALIALVVLLFSLFIFNKNNIFQCNSNNVTIVKVYNEVPVSNGDLSNIDIPKEHDSAKIVYDNKIEMNDPLDIEILLKIGNIELIKSNYANAEIYYKVAIDQSIKQDKPLLKLYSNMNLALVKIEYGDFRNAIPLLKRGVEYFKENNKPIQLVITYKNLGFAYFESNNIDSSLKYYYLTIHNAAKNLEKIKIQANSGIGLIYLQKKLFDSSYYYFNSAFHQAKEEHEKNKINYEMGLVYGNFSIYYFVLGENEQGFEYLAASGKYFKNSISQESIAIFYSNMGDYYFKNEFLQESYYYYDSARVIYELIDLKKELSETYKWMGKICIMQLQCEKTIEFYKKAKKYCLQTNFPAEYCNEYDKLIINIKRKIEKGDCN